jgi:hypothetical protein
MAIRKARQSRPVWLRRATAQSISMTVDAADSALSTATVQILKPNGDDVLAATAATVSSPTAS